MRMLSVGGEGLDVLGWKQGMLVQALIPQPRTRTCSSPRFSVAGFDHSDSLWAGPTRLLDAGLNTLAFTHNRAYKEA